jgi:hypothetical protein
LVKLFSQELKRLPSYGHRFDDSIAENRQAFGIALLGNRLRERAGHCFSNFIPAQIFTKAKQMAILEHPAGTADRAQMIHNATVGCALE